MKKRIINKYDFYKYVVIIILLSTLWILMALNTYNADYRVYMNNYKHIGMGESLNRFEPLFTLSMQLGNMLGMSYQTYLMFISTLCIIMIFIFVKKYSSRPGLVLLLYLIFPFFYDIIQIRNTISFCIILYGIRFLEKFSVKNLIFYLICVLLAINVHKSSVFYLFFLCAYLKKERQVYTFISILFFIEVYLLISGSKLFFSLFNNFDVDSMYYSSNLDIYKSFGYFIISCILIFILKYKNKHKINQNTTFIYKIAPVIIVAIPLIAFNQAFYRFFRNGLILFYVLISNKSSENRDSVVVLKKREIVNICMILVIPLYFFYKQLSFFAPGYSDITKAILENNLLFQGIKSIILSILSFF